MRPRAHRTPARHGVPAGAGSNCAARHVALRHSPVSRPCLPNPLAHLPFPFKGVDYAAKGYHVEATVSPDQVVSAAEQLDKEGFALDTITGRGLAGRGADGGGL